VEVMRQVRSAIRRRFTAEEKIRIVLEGLREAIPAAELCPREEDRLNDVLPLVEDLSGGWQERPDAGHAARSDRRRQAHQDGREGSQEEKIEILSW